MRTLSTVMDPVPPGNSKERRSCRQQVVPLMNEDSDPCVVSHINYIVLYVDQHREVYSTQKAQHETVANIQDTQVVNLWSNDHVLSYELAGSVKPRPTVTLEGLPTSWVVEYIRTD